MEATPEFIIRAWFEDLWNRGDETTIDRYLHADGVIHGLPTPTGRSIRGPVEFKPFYQGFRAAFPDISIELVHVLSQGNMAVAHCRVIGTHKGSTLGFPATNRAIDMQGFALGRFERGLLIEGWNCFDFLGMYQQLGIQLNLPEASQTRGA
jgi:steroid delta-isomerase-like uncharacterized protein